MTNQEKALQRVFQDAAACEKRLAPLRKQAKAVIRKILGKCPNAGGNFCTVINRDLSEEILRGIVDEDQAAIDRFFKIYHMYYPTAEDWEATRESRQRFREQRAWSLAHPFQGGSVSPR